MEADEETMEQLQAKILELEINNEMFNRDRLNQKQVMESQEHRIQELTNLLEASERKAELPEQRLEAADSSAASSAQEAERLRQRVLDLERQLGAATARAAGPAQGTERLELERRLEAALKDGATAAQEVAAKTAALADRDAALAQLQQHLEGLRGEGAPTAPGQPSAQLEKARGRADWLRSQLAVRAREAQRMEHAIVEERREGDRLRDETAWLQRKLAEAQAALSQAEQRQLGAEAAQREAEEAAAAREEDLQDLLRKVRQELEGERALRAAAEQEVAACKKMLGDERQRRAAAEADLSALKAKLCGVGELGKRTMTLADILRSDNKLDQEDALEAEEAALEPEAQPAPPAAAEVQLAGRSGPSTRARQKGIMMDQQEGAQNPQNISAQQHDEPGQEPAALAPAATAGACAARPRAAGIARRRVPAAEAATDGEASSFGPIVASLAAGSGQGAASSAAGAGPAVSGPGKAKAKQGERTQAQVDSVNRAVQAAVDNGRGLHLQEHFRQAVAALPAEVKAKIRAAGKNASSKLWNALYGGGAEGKAELCRDMRRVGFPGELDTIYIKFTTGAKHALAAEEATACN